MRATEPRGYAGARLDAVGKRQRELRLRGGRSRRLEPVRAVVAVQDDHRGLWKRALEVSANEIVGLGLVVDDLHRGGKFSLALAVATLSRVARHRPTLAPTSDKTAEAAGDEGHPGAQEHEDPLEQALVGILLSGDRRAQVDHRIARLLYEGMALVGLRDIRRPGAERAACQGKPALVE